MSFDTAARLAKSRQPTAWQQSRRRESAAWMRSWAEHSPIQLHARFAQSFIECWRLSETSIASENFPAFGESFLTKFKQWLSQDHIAFEPIDSNDRGDAATTIAEARELHDDVHGGGDLFSNRAHRQF